MVTVTRWVTRAGCLAACLAVVASSAGCATLAAPPIMAVAPPPNPVAAPARDVVLVGNNWEGTVVAFDPNPPFRRLKTFNMVPDAVLLKHDIDRSLRRRLEMLAIRKAAGEGHDQLVDDVFTSPDGRYLYASRPSHKDVVAIDVTNPASPTPHWRRPVAGHSRRSRGDLGGWHEAPGLGFDREESARIGHRDRQDRAVVPVRRRAAREQLLGTMAPRSSTPASVACSCPRRQTSSID